MTQKPLEEMSAFFDLRHEIYDEVHTANIDGGAESKRIPALYLPERMETLLDLGIGTGLELEAVFERFPRAQVTGLDISAGLVRQLKSKYPTRYIKVILESYLTYDLGSSCYDAAVSVMSLHHYTPEVKTELYRRILHALKPGGTYVECDYMLSDAEFSNPQSEQDALFAMYERLRVEQGLDSKLEYHFDTPCTVHNQIHMLQAAGFISVKEVWRRKNTVVLTAGKEARA